MICSIFKKSFLWMALLNLSACLISPQPAGPDQRRMPLSPHSMNDIELMMLQQESPLRSPEELEYNQIQQAQVSQQHSLAIGMPKKYVRLNLGSPQEIEVAGHPKYGNERWTYERAVPTLNGFYYERQRVYFENGEVVGWETN